MSHPYAAEAHRAELAEFFAKQNPGHHVMATDMLAQLQRVGLTGYLSTVARVAKGLPIYDVWLL